MLPSLLGVLAGTDPAGQPAEALAEALRMLEQTDAVGAAARGRLLEVFDAQDGHLADGQRSTRTWLVNCTRVTRGQASEYQAVQALARDHAVLLAALAEGDVLTKSVALQLARWTRPIPADCRAKAEEILVAAARAGPACGRWPRSAPRSGTAPRSPTRTMRTTGTWTAACRSTPPWTGRECCMAT